ncbi:hypothetical protein ACOQFV_24060 [Nocardiopsis changdeensis]|uniref:Uncharacterized protein n=1 Tax=Nocardiopsis changdeensis TaxID=2831969 RepID=A0A975QCP7_9ACTN|nr:MULTISPECIES: hypothetical protein [Nocardiopsis]QUX26530.1 hypothetical protein KGD84_33060 [Nocardiopsis changdeensis]QYX40649.1 hypothetical protein K1J57_32130 [Nocardiopsis sp. MT53]
MVFAPSSAPVPLLPMSPEEPLVAIGEDLDHLIESVGALTGEDPVQVLTGITPTTRLAMPAAVVLDLVGAGHDAFAWGQLGLLLRLICDQDPDMVRFDVGTDPRNLLSVLLLPAARALHELGVPVELWAFEGHQGPVRIPLLTGTAWAPPLLPHLAELAAFDHQGRAARVPGQELDGYAYQAPADGGYVLTPTGALLRGLLVTAS